LLVECIQFRRRVLISGGFTVSHDRLQSKQTWLSKRAEIGQELPIGAARIMDEQRL